MKNKAPESSDFFDRYRRARMFAYILPGFFGAFIALWLVSMTHTSDTRGLMASVAQIAQPQYGADIVMERNGDTIRLIMGKTAQKVDTISLRFLSNPADALVFIPSTGTVVDEAEGVYLYVRLYGSEDVTAGTVIATFSGVPSDAPIALTDTEFESGGVKYSLTSKWE
jgi:hypothetical protein